MTRGGRFYVGLYSGGTCEPALGNYVAVYRSDDGKDFGEPITVAFAGEQKQCYDESMWLDPDGRLWLFINVFPDMGVYAAVCDDPDAEKIVWREPRKVARGTMLNKPIVLASGRWLLPVAVWTPKCWESRKHICTVAPDDSAAYVYASDDKGETFSRLGGATGKERSFDEHNILERKDGTLAMYTRTHYGVGLARSSDGGKTWSEIENSGIPGPDARFHVRRLPSGRVLMVNHSGFTRENVSWFTGRSHLTAMLSDDDGATFPHKLLLDERTDISYPDAALGPDGSIYVAYDRERYGAKEILLARITEPDILSSALNDKNSFLKRVIIKA